MPEGQPQQATAGHRLFHRLTGFGVLELINRIDVFEHEGQIEDAELLGELLELRQRRRGQLNVALQHRFQNLVVVVESRVRENLHTGFAVHLFVHTFLQQRGSNAFRVLVGVGHVAELDDDFAVVTSARSHNGRSGHCQGHCGRGGGQKFHNVSSREIICFLVFHRTPPPGAAMTEFQFTSARSRKSDGQMK